MSEFAKKELQKYGWKEGKGLGREENGIAAPIKTKYKFDTCGIGHDISKEYTSTWWSHAFNEAANNISVTNSENGVCLTTKKRKKKNCMKKDSVKYQGFIKAGTLDADGVIANIRKEVEEKDEIDTHRDIKWTDEELFSSCGGRTAHKGARFGLTMNGKLNRLMEQEKLFCEENNSLDSEACNQRKRKSRKK